jgi:hypothetical protein
MRRSLALAAFALAGCGAQQQAAAPKPRPAKVSQACSTPPRPAKPSTALPSARLVATLGVLRRPKTAADTPPPGAFAREPFIGGAMLDAARRTAQGWIVPVEDVLPRFDVSAACLRSMPAKQRNAIRQSGRRAPVEGVMLVGAAAQPGRRWSTDDIVAGRAFAIQGCTGPMHNRITVSGVVPDGVSQVTVTGRDGGIIQATPAGNLVAVERDRPDSPAGLPAHITSTTSSKPLEVALDPRSTRNLDKPCEPPTRTSIGKRREPPPKLPGGARLELTTNRWQPEDSNPLIAGATTRTTAGRCLLIDTEKRLRQGRAGHRFCVDDDKLRAERFIVNLTRLPSGDVILEGFVDPQQVSWITVERSTIASGAFRLPPARRSGAFFVAVRGRYADGGTFELHAARRGAPVRYTRLWTVRLNPLP